MAKYVHNDLAGFFSLRAWLVCFVRLHFAVVTELLIAVLTQLLLRALIIFYTVVAASVRLLGTGIIINLQWLVNLRSKEMCSLEEQAGGGVIELFVVCFCLCCSLAVLL